MKSTRRKISLIFLISLMVMMLMTGFSIASSSPPEVNGSAYVLYDATTDTFLLGENQDEALSPASITKVMTVLLALENLELDETITITKEMFIDIPNDYVRLGLIADEVLTVEELLYANLLISANDASMAIALTLSDSVEGFSRMMNERAAELGCTNTHFTNPYGLADPEHLTSAHDMALILSKALEYEDFVRISTTRYHAMEKTEFFDGNRGLPNGNKFVEKGKYAYEYYIGGKTGYTDLSKNTLVAGAVKDGRKLVSVILGAPVPDQRYIDMRALFDHGFSKYAVLKLEENDFAEIRGKILSELENNISSNGMDLEISGSQIEVCEAVDVCADEGKAEPFVLLSGDALTQIDPNAGSQSIEYPLFCDDAAAEDIRIGTLTVQLESTTPSVASQPDDTGERKGLVIFSNILKIFASLIAAVILVAGLLILYALITRRKRRSKRRRPPAPRR